jgi:hypothetical protein
MTRVEYYLAKALECEQMARGARDAETKRQLKELASEWRLLAAHAERQGS